MHAAGEGPAADVDGGIIGVDEWDVLFVLVTTFGVEDDVIEVDIDLFERWISEGHPE